MSGGVREGERLGVEGRTLPVTEGVTIGTLGVVGAGVCALLARAGASLAWKGLQVASRVSKSLAGFIWLRRQASWEF